MLDAELPKIETKDINQRLRSNLLGGLMSQSNLEIVRRRSHGDNYHNLVSFFETVDSNTVNLEYVKSIGRARFGGNTENFLFCAALCNQSLYVKPSENVYYSQVANQVNRDALVEAIMGLATDRAGHFDKIITDYCEVQSISVGQLLLGYGSYLVDVFAEPLEVSDELRGDTAVQKAQSMVQDLFKNTEDMGVEVARLEHTYRFLQAQQATRAITADFKSDVAKLRQEQESAAKVLQDELAAAEVARLAGAATDIVAARSQYESQIAGIQAKLSEQLEQIKADAAVRAAQLEAASLASEADIIAQHAQEVQPPDAAPSQTRAMIKAYLSNMSTPLTQEERDDILSAETLEAAIAAHTAITKAKYEEEAKREAARVAQELEMLEKMRQEYEAKMGELAMARAQLEERHARQKAEFAASLSDVSRDNTRENAVTTVTAQTVATDDTPVQTAAASDSITKLRQEDEAAEGDYQKTLLILEEIKRLQQKKSEASAALFAKARERRDQVDKGFKDRLEEHKRACDEARSIWLEQTKKDPSLLDTSQLVLPEFDPENSYQSELDKITIELRDGLATIDFEYANKIADFNTKLQGLMSHVDDQYQATH